MNHNDFIGWSTVMFTVLCIYEIHQISQNPMFPMVSYVLFSVRKPSSEPLKNFFKLFYLKRFH